MYQSIRAAIKNVLDGITSIPEVHDTDMSSFAKYPAAVVVPSQNTADYSLTAPESNKETYIFTIRLHYPFTEGQATADHALDVAADSVITAFRNRNILGDAADWVAPVPSIWGYQSRPDGQMRIAEVTIRATKYVENGS
jgi:hypothetical protein